MKYSDYTYSLEEFDRTIDEADKHRYVLLHFPLGIEKDDILSTLENCDPKECNLALEIFYKFKELAEKRSKNEEGILHEGWRGTWMDFDRAEIKTVSKIITKADENSEFIPQLYVEKLRNKISQIRIEKYGDLLEIPSADGVSHRIESFKEDWLDSMKKNIAENPQNRMAEILPVAMLCEKWQETLSHTTEEEMDADNKKFGPDRLINMTNNLYLGKKYLAEILSVTPYGEILGHTLESLANLSEGSFSRLRLNISSQIMRDAFTSYAEQPIKKEIKKEINEAKERMLNRRAEKEAAIKRYNENKNKKFYTADDLEFELHQGIIAPNWRARIMFENGWGASVIDGNFVQNKAQKIGFGAYGDYEIAVLNKDGKPDYTTDITPGSEPIGVMGKDELNEILKKIQKLDKNGKLPLEYSEAENAVSGVVVADKIAQYKTKDLIDDEITPEKGKKLSESIKRQYLMNKKQKG